jgi:hypothetical protein
MRNLRDIATAQCPHRRGRVYDSVHAAPEYVGLASGARGNLIGEAFGRCVIKA